MRRRKPSGLIQYTITLPKEYAEKLEAEGISKLLVVYNHGLGAFPSQGAKSEAGILAFLNAHPDLKRMIVAEKEVASE